MPSEFTSAAVGRYFLQLADVHLSQLLYEYTYLPVFIVSALSASSRDTPHTKQPYNNLQ